jgi:hypothetical protein
MFFVCDGSDGVVLQSLHSFRGLWKSQHVDWRVDFWKWSVKEILVGAIYDF